MSESDDTNTTRPLPFENLVGNTPLVQVPYILPNYPAQLLLKLEYRNPGGSSKDRAALEMVTAAEREGVLQPGATIVEPTSGNTGIALALIAAQHGYEATCVVTSKTSAEKIDRMQQLGAAVIVCDAALARDNPRSNYSIAARLLREISNSFGPNQYSNPNNPLAHYKTTGPEIWQQTEGRVTHLIAGIGTGGTITGIGRFLKEKNPSIRVIGVNPQNSPMIGGSGHPDLVEGVGGEATLPVFDPAVVDEMVSVSDLDAFDMTRTFLIKTSGIGGLVGPSGAMTLVVAEKIEGQLDRSDVVVAVIPDSGFNYFSKAFNTEWLMERGLVRG